MADRETRILFVESNDLELAAYRRQIRRCGMWDVSCISNQGQIEDQIKDTYFNAIMIEMPIAVHYRESLNLLSGLRAFGYRGIIAMMSESASLEIVYRCARLGASEFLLKTSALDLGLEIERLLQRRPSVDRSLWHPQMNMGFGIFTSAGLTACELEIVLAFAKGFPKHGDIARQLGKSEPYIRKNFSRIYNKVSQAIPLENSSQLAHLITICALYT